MGSTDGRLDLCIYAYRSSEAVTLVENNPQLAENKNSKELHYTAEDPPAARLSIQQPMFATKLTH